MKIAIVCFNLSWQSGGPRLVFSSARTLKGKGHKVVIYAPEFSGEYFKELWNELDIRVVSAPKLFQPRKSGNFLEWVKSKLALEKLQTEIAKRIAAAIDLNSDVLNVHDFAYPTAYFFKKRNPRVRVIWTENDPPFAYLPKGSLVASILSRIYNVWKEIKSRKYFRAIDQAAVLDLYNQAWCQKRGLKTVITRLGVDPKFYLPVKDFKERAKTKKVRLFGLGSLNEYRRYEDTILAVRHLRDWGYDASALIIASDIWNERIYREKIQTIIKENDLEKSINFQLKGVSEEGLRQAYEETDVFVYAMYNPPPRDGFGFSIGVFEAMAAGLPVVLCQTTTSVEVLEDKKSALFVDPMSPRQIAEKIKFLVDNPALYQKIASAGQKLVKNELTWDKYADRFLRAVSLADNI